MPNTKVKTKTSLGRFSFIPEQLFPYISLGLNQPMYRMRTVPSFIQPFQLQKMTTPAQPSEIRTVWERAHDEAQGLGQVTVLPVRQPRGLRYSTETARPAIQSVRFHLITQLLVPELGPGEYENDLRPTPSSLAYVN